MERLWFEVMFAAMVVGAFGALILTGCQARLPIGMPFGGPGYDSDRGVIHPDAGETVVVSLTNALVHSDKRGPFDDYTMAVYKTMDTYEGYIAGSIRKELLGDEVWTISVWTDEASLMKFVRSPIHQEAIRVGYPAIKKVRFARLQLPSRELPISWERAKQLLDEEEAKQAGRFKGY